MLPPFWTLALTVNLSVTGKVLWCMTYIDECELLPVNTVSVLDVHSSSYLVSSAPCFAHQSRITSHCSRFRISICSRTVSRACVNLAKRNPRCCQWLERTEQTAVTVNRTASLRATIIPYVQSQSNKWTVSSDTVYSSEIFRSAGDYVGK